MATLAKGDMSDSRKCTISGENMDRADLGLCLNLKAQKVANGKLPEITMIPGSYVSRIEFNKGIKEQELSDRPYVLAHKDWKGTHATNWFPLTLRKDEHWQRTCGPYGTKTMPVSNVVKSKKAVAPNNHYYLLDYSSSMSGPYINTCIESLVDMTQNTVPDNDFVSMAVFNSGYTPCFGLLQKKEHLNHILGEIKKHNRPNGCTSFYKALLHTLMYADFTRPVTVVALTDGDDNDRDQSANFNALMKKMNEYKLAKRNLKMIVITVGSISQEYKIKQILEVAPVGHLIRADANAQGIKNAYEKAKKLIVGSNGDENAIVGTQDLLMSAFSLIVSGENGHFKEEDIWRVSARLLNLSVVAFSKGERAVTAETMRDYCDIHRTVVEMFRNYPAIKNNMLTSLNQFMDKNTPNNRRRDLIPDLGEAIQLLALVDEIGWDQFAEVYVQEIFRRTARWTQFNIKQDAEESKQLKYFWPQMKVSMLLMAFNVLFLRDIVHRDGRTIDQLAQVYDSTLQYVNDDQLEEFVGKFNFVRELDDFSKVMEFVGVSGKPKDILKLIYVGKTYEMEPTTNAKTNFIAPSNNIANIQVPLVKPNQPNGVDFKNYKPSSTIKQRSIQHLGWNLELSSISTGDLERLRNCCGSHILKHELYTAVLFSESQLEKEELAQHIAGKTMDGVINGYYINNDAVVGDLVVDGLIHKVVLTILKGHQPNHIKQKAQNGLMGPKIDIIPIHVSCTGVVHYRK